MTFTIPNYIIQKVVDKIVFKNKRDGDSFSFTFALIDGIFFFQTQKI